MQTPKYCFVLISSNNCSSFWRKTRDITSGESWEEQPGKIFITCWISSHCGLHVIVRKMLGCPTFLQTASTSWKFCCMYRLEPKKLAGRIKPFPVVLESKFPLLIFFFILVYKSFRRLLWWVRNHYKRDCSIHEKASTMYCWKSRPLNRTCIPSCKIIFGIY